MLLGWFATKEIDAFADSIVAELVARFPKSGVDVSSRKSAERAMKGLDKMYSSITSFALEHRPNLYQKARFGNRIKWALKEAKYPDPFIEVATDKFVAYMTVSVAPRPASRG